MKSLILVLILQLLTVTLPVDKDIASMQFDVTGFDVQNAYGQLQEGKTLDWNRLSNKQSRFLIYGGQDLLGKDNKIVITGYQSLANVKLTNVIGASLEAEKVNITNRYEKI